MINPTPHIYIYIFQAKSLPITNICKKDGSLHQGPHEEIEIWRTVTRDATRKDGLHRNRDTGRISSTEERAHTVKRGQMKNSLMLPYDN
jgi:hypothetical protein